MTEAPERSEAARLDELAAVTKAYAWYSDAGVGLSASLTGAWLLASEWVLRAAPRAGELLLVYTPLVSIAFFAAARAYYQRHGEVVGSPQADSWLLRPMWVGLVFLMSLIGIDNQFEGMRQGYELLAVAGFLATAMLAVRMARTRPTTVVVVGSLMMLVANHGHRLTLDAPSGSGWALITAGVLYVIVGVVGHVRYRRLERRLAALKERA